MKQKVVIIGVSYSSRLSLARAIGRNGYDITLVSWGDPKRPKKPIDGYSKYVSRWLVCEKEEKPFINLLKEKCACKDQKVVLIPDCDFSVTVIDKHQNELRSFFLMPHINHSQGAIVNWSDKMMQKSLAVKLGMNVAKASVIDIINGNYSLSSNIHYPCFPKALSSVLGGKAGMRRCNDNADLERSLQDIIKRKTCNAKVMLEEYMEIEREYAVLGVSDGRNVCIPGVIQFIEGSKTQRGIALQGLIMPILGFEALIGKFKSLIREIGLVGLFDIDFYQCRGQLFFSELNIRYGGSGYAVVKEGINLPLMFVKSICGQEVQGWDTIVEKEAIFTNERMAFNDLNNGLITYNKYHNFIKSADILFIKDTEDPKPHKMYKKSLLRAIVKSVVKGLVR